MNSQVPCAEKNGKSSAKKIIQFCAICRTDESLTQFKDKLICSECITDIKDSKAQ